eukprot:6271142-Prymnesium_polylepis.1
MSAATAYSEYERLASQLDKLDGKDAWRSAPSSIFNLQAVTSTATQLREAREAGDIEGLSRLLCAVMHRNHLNVDAAALHRECRVGTKVAIQDM